MQTIHYNISDKKALSTPDKPVLVAGESGTSEIVLSTAPAAWTGFEIRALLTTPARKLVDAFAVGSGFLLTNTMLDAQGYLYVEFVAYRGGSEIDRSLPDKLYINAGRKAEGDIDPEPLPDLVAEMVAAKGDCDDAAAAAVLATERMETTDADIQAAEVIRQSAEIFRGTNESGRVAAENIRAGFYDGFDTHLTNIEQQVAGKKIKIIAGTVRNEGSGWAFIVDSVHQADLNCLSVTADASFLTIFYGFTASKVVSFLTVPDESFASFGYFCGATVGKTTSSIKIYKSVPRSVGCVATCTNYGFSLGAYSSGITSLVWDEINYVLRITHSSMKTNISSNSSAPTVIPYINGKFIAVIKAVSTSYVDVEFYNFDGSKIIALGTNLSFAFNRTSAEENSTALIPPNTLVNASGNIWFMGIFEVE